MSSGPSQAGTTIQHLVRRAFRRHADRPLLVWEGGGATYAETGTRVARLAAWMCDRAGVGARAAIVLDNSREYLEAVLACALGGQVRVPLSPKDPVEQLVVKLVESRTRVVVTTPALADALRDWIADAGAVVLVVGPGGTGGADHPSYDEVVDGYAGGPVPEVAETDPYRLSFTGGTTGVPKAVVQTHRQERAMARNLLMEAMTPVGTPTFVAATPLAHAAGSFVLPSVLTGRALSWLSRFDPGRLADPSWLGDRLTSDRVETFVVPTALADLATAAEGGHRLASVVYGGAPCPAPTLEAALGSIGADALVQVYGQAEAPMTICVAGREDHRERRVADGWVGHPFMFVDIELANPDATGAGEIVVHAEHVMSGYFNRPEESQERLTESGGLRTGDLGRFDDRGGLAVVGRVREIVISGGFNIYPDQIENRLRDAVGGVDIAAFGVPHSRWGEALVVAVVGQGEATTAVERLNTAAEEHLVYYERPKDVVVVPELPLTAVGKVSRQELARRFTGHFAGHVEG